MTQIETIDRSGWRAGIWAGLAAGAVFIVMKMVLVGLAGDSPWAPPRMIAAIVLGKNVLPPPATFDPVIVAVAMAIHFVLSIIFGLFFAAIVERLVRPAWRTVPLIVLLGVVFGIAIYIVSFYGFTAVFP